MGTQGTGTPVSDWSKPKDVSRSDCAFGNVNGLLPRWDEIPKEFKHGRTGWNSLASEWFFSGLDKGRLVAKDDIDANKAIAHLSTILRSFNPEHEHKEAGVAYLMSLWLKPECAKGAA